MFPWKTPFYFIKWGLSDLFLAPLYVRSNETTGASSYSYVFAILNMFPLEFWNKWYTIGKPLYRALWIRKKNWAWHHPMDGHAHLTEKASLLLKPVWSLPWQKSFQFQNCFQLPLFRAFFWGMSLFSRTTGLEMAGRQSLKSGKKVQILMIYVVKCIVFQNVFQTSNFAGRPFLCQLSIHRMMPRPFFFPGSKSSILGLSHGISFVSEF